MKKILSQFSGDLHYLHGLYQKVLSRIDSKAEGKTYFYRFDMQTSLNMVKNMYKVKEEGACHCDDISYLFYSHEADMKAPGIQSKEHEMIKNMVSAVTSFMITGKPSSDILWKPLSPSEKTLKCLNFSNDSIEVIPFPEQDRLRAWDEILKDF